jgi:TRAP-type C4-dicarboxylate transport system substrate-binding protein
MDRQHIRPDGANREALEQDVNESSGDLRFLRRRPIIGLGTASLVVAAVLAIGAAGCSTGNLDKAGGSVPSPVVPTLADGLSDYSDVQPFANAVGTLSHGALQIKIESDWRPSDPTYELGVIKDVRAGKAELGITASRAFDLLGIDSFQALQAPLLIDNYELERKVLSSGIPAKMLDGLRPYGLVGIGILPGPLRRPLSFGRPLLAASDYTGSVIGIAPSQVSADIFNMLGANAVPEGRLNSTTGMTGVEAHADLIDAGYATPGAVLTGNVVLEPRPDVIFMNQHAFRSLSLGERHVLLRAAAIARSGGIFQGDDLTSAADLCRRGIKIVAASPADLSGLRAAVQPLYQSLEENPSTKTYISQIAAIRQAAGGAPDTLTCPAGSTGGISSPGSALDGTWQVSYTEGELVAAGDATSSAGEGNWGHFTLTFRHGHWWQRLVGGDPGVTPNNVLAYGTYNGAGDKIIFYVHSHNYPGSDTAVMGPYTWSVYRDMLTFKKDGWTGNTLGPTGYVVKPWTRM